MSTNKQLVILDGGCGMELKRRKAMGLDVAYEFLLFSVSTLMQTPHAIKTLHRDYIKMGAQVITTASYAVTRHYLQLANAVDRIDELARLSVRLAREAVDAEGASGRVRVAGSVPPLGESYHMAHLSRADLMAQYGELIPALSGVDILLLETMNSIEEIECAVQVVRRHFADSPVDIWVAFNVCDF